MVRQALVLSCTEDVFCLLLLYLYSCEVFTWMNLVFLKYNLNFSNFYLANGRYDEILQADCFSQGSIKNRES